MLFEATVPTCVAINPAEGVSMCIQDLHHLHHLCVVGERGREGGRGGGEGGRGGGEGGREGGGGSLTEGLIITLQ